MSLVAEGLVKSYGGRRVVNGVSVQVQRGEILPPLAELLFYLAVRARVDRRHE